MYKRVIYLAFVYWLGTSLVSPVVAANKTYQLTSGETISDPTMPAGWGARASSGGKKTVYKLNYILNAHERKQAIVNGKKVTEGDVVAGARVLRISDAEVVLSVNGKRQTLRVNKKRKGIKQSNN